MSTRHSFQYSLRGHLIVVTAFLAFLGVQVNRANRQRDAVVELEDVTISIEYDYERETEDAEINYSRLPKGWPWLRNLLGADYFDTVVAIAIQGANRPISDQDLYCIARLNHLRYISIGGATSITARGCDSLANLNRNVKGLYFDNVPGDALAKIATLEELRILWFTRAQVSVSAMNSLGHLHSLRELVLNDCTVDDSSTVALCGLANLRRLDLENTRISDIGVAQLSKMRLLESLSVAKTPVTDACLVHLMQMPSLKELDLTETSVTDAGAVGLAAFPNLKALSIARTSVTPAGVRALKLALPNCRVDTSRASPEGEDF